MSDTTITLLELAAVCTMGGAGIMLMGVIVGVLMGRATVKERT